ncbi:membrane protein [Angustibacter peucedani]
MSEVLRSARDGVRSRVDVVTLLVVYALTRVWGAVFIARAAEHQPQSIWTGPRSNYFDMAQLWDGQWYKIIAEHGYPAELPLDQLGNVQQNPWAFFPGFPCTVRAVMAVTDLPFAVAAVAVNLVLGACAVHVVMRVLQKVAGRRAGWGGAVLLCAFPSAPSLQIAYSESLALLLLALAAWWLLERRYGWAALAVLALSLTRPVVAPFAVVVLTHLVVRWVRAARGREPFPWSQRLAVVGLGLLSAASSILWPALVGLRLGSSDAYERTQAAWRTGGVIQPFHQAVGISHLLWGDRGPTYLVLGGIALVALVLSPWGRRVGPELQTWTLAYPLYLLAVTEPWTSTFRYLLLVFPLWGVLAVAVRSRWAVAALAVVGLWWQVHWVDDLLLFHPPTDFPP